MDLAVSKNKSIELVLSKLFRHFGENNFCLTDFWDADLQAIGIKNASDGDFLIYISTHKMTKNNYFVEIERANSKFDLTNYAVVERFEKIDFGKLTELVKRFLF